MTIIDLMTALTGVGMGLLAFLVIGGITGACAWGFFPSTKSRPKSFQKLITAAFIGFLAALGSSYLGQFTNSFQSGQILEWLSAILASCLVGAIYAALSKVDSNTKCNFDKRLVAKDVLVSKASRPASQSSHDLSTP